MRQMPKRQRDLLKTARRYAPRKSVMVGEHKRNQYWLKGRARVIAQWERVLATVNTICSRHDRGKATHDDYRMAAFIRDLLDDTFGRDDNAK